MEQTISAQNNKIKLANKPEKRKERGGTGLALIESIHLIDEAFKGSIMVKQLLVIEPKRTDSRLLEHAKGVYEIDMRVAESLSGTIIPQGFFTAIEKPKRDISKAKQVLLLDRIQDLDDLGTLIRVTDAAGIDMVVTEKGTADVHRDEAMRISQGSVFHIPTVTTELNEFIEQFDGPVYDTALENAVSYRNVESQDISTLLLSNEGEGASKELLVHISQDLIMPIYGKTESLNVAIAGSILLYHSEG